MIKSLIAAFAAASLLAACAATQDQASCTVTDVATGKSVQVQAGDQCRSAEKMSLGGTAN